MESKRKEPDREYISGILPANSVREAPDPTSIDGLDGHTATFDSTLRIEECLLASGFRLSW